MNTTEKILIGLILVISIVSSVIVITQKKESDLGYAGLGGYPNVFSSSTNASTSIGLQNTVLVARNDNRRYLFIENQSNSLIWCSLNATSSVGNGFRLDPLINTTTTKWNMEFDGGGIPTDAVACTALVATGTVNYVER